MGQAIRKSLEHVLTLVGAEEEGVDIRLGMEFSQIDSLFSGANVGNGDSQLLGDREGDTAFSCSVELGDQNVGDLDRFGEFLRLEQTILPSGRVDDQKYFLWSF